MSDPHNSDALHAGEDVASAEAVPPPPMPEITTEDIAAAERRAKPVFAEDDHVFVNLPMTARSPIGTSDLHYVRGDWWVVGCDTDPLAGWDAQTPGLRPDDIEDARDALAMLNAPGRVEKIAMGRDIRKLLIAAVQIAQRNDKLPAVKLASEKAGDRIVDVRPLRYLMEFIGDDEVVSIVSVAPVVTGRGEKKSVPAVRFEGKHARGVMVCAIWQAEQVPGATVPDPMFSVAGFFATNPATVPTDMLTP